MKILLVEDDVHATNYYAEVLTHHQYLVNSTNHGQTGLEMAIAYDYDLVLLDVMLPDIDGLRICRTLRQEGRQMPILMLTAQASTRDRVQGLEAGADDYVAKPVEDSELVARIQALLRRGRQPMVDQVTWERLRLDFQSRVVSYDDQPIHLTPKEYGILELFLRYPQRVFSRRVILDSLWSLDESPSELAVNTHIKGLRQKLKEAGLQADWLETVYGIGYRLRPAPESVPERLEAAAPPLAASASASSQGSERLTALMADLWQEYQPSLAAQMQLLKQTAKAAAAGQLTVSQREQAAHEAHKLVGTLGTHGLMDAATLARQLDRQLRGDEPLGPSAASGLMAAIANLKRSIRQYSAQLDANPPTRNADRPVQQGLPNVLAVTADPAAIQVLSTQEMALALELTLVDNPTTARDRLHQGRPDGIVLDLSCTDATANGLDFLAELGRDFPQVPVTVMTDQNQLSDRLAVSRLGGQAFVSKPISSELLLQAIAAMLHGAAQPDYDILVVDDDPAILTAVSAILSDQQMQVTQLSNPQRFWETLEAVRPDLLILDVEMPHHSGLDLCEAVRIDLRWHHLPILFLSAHRNPDIVQHVFQMGADDYVHKPVVASELVARVRHRLTKEPAALQAMSSSRS